MDAQKLKFMMAVQDKIDTLCIELGTDNNLVIELKKQFENLSEAEIENSPDRKSDPNLLPIKADTAAIRNHLEIKADVSIDYRFITNERVKNQLVKDNIRMENSRLNVTKDDHTRFYDFCVEAFFQIEESINYFFAKKFSFEEFLIRLNKDSSNPILDKTYSEIPISKKIYLFENMYCYNQLNAKGHVIRYNSTINFIRDIRNEGLHRCNIIEQDKEQCLIKGNVLIKKIGHNKQNNINYIKTKVDKEVLKEYNLIKFIREKNYNLVRVSLQDLVSTIKINL